jgi:type IV pilus assembly protein PilV
MDTQRRTGGFTLIEVLVALLVLAVGALGAGATVLAARRAGQQASLASGAVELAALAGDAMRANAPAMGVADAYNPYLQLDYDAHADGPPAAVADCSASTCDSAALAAADLAALRRSVFQHYPLGRIKICRDSAWWDRLGLVMRWDCNGASGAPVVVKIGWQHRLAQAGEVAGGAPALVILPVLAGHPAGVP